jgi:hypothetical protein
MQVPQEALAAACRAGFGAEAPRVERDLAGLRSLLEWLLVKVARRRFSREDLRAGYSSRSPREVIAQACVPFTAPCADLASVAALLAAAQGFELTLVLGGVKRAFRPTKFQAGLEVDVGSSTWVVGFGEGRSVLYEGRFQPTPRRTLVFRRRPPELDLDRTFIGYFEPMGLEGLGRLIPGYDLERDVRDHIRRSGALAFHLARRRSRRSSPVSLVCAASWEAA